ncbi:MAG TPA: DNA-3-methyladenine glycosylase [Methyloceanibacter sp.]|jgi:DNA-3-methyladenine glycosylase|nr:DNA-3-methyladenine glycosylase [Methyloceanibacter sp.]
MLLNQDFFDQAADKVAFHLIGCRLHWHEGKQSQSRLITETEAYIGPEDLASHAARGRTERNDALFGPSGRFYVYLIYGRHWMLNVVTGPIGFPAAVLIRSLDGLKGPARVTKALNITGDLNGQIASEKTGVWFTETPQPVRRPIIRSARIGVEYSGPVWSQKPYRFVLSSK